MSKPAWKTVPAQQAPQSPEHGLLIDVRTPVEYAQCHLPGSINVPLETLNPARLEALAGSHGLQAGEPVFLICQGGIRATQAAGQLASKCAYPLAVIEGGINACSQNGLAMNRRDIAIWSLERQVRFSAGLLVAGGGALGYFVHPGFLAVAAFVGAGLMQAAITEFCPMGLLIARMPWNRKA